MQNDGITFFASGSNHSGEIRALSLVTGANVGVVADRVTESYAAARVELARFGGCVFVDSGAFEEVTFPGGVPTITKPLGPAHWAKVFRVYREVAREHMERAYLVAPDCVAHQAESLERLERYAEDVIELWELGANVLVPMQKGAISMAEFAERVDVLLDGASWIPAIPMKKDATKLPELRAFLEARRPSAIHLLGTAPDSKTGAAAIALVREVLPGCEISCDACLAMRWVGKTNGKGGGPRRYTALSELHAAKLEATAKAHGLEFTKAQEVHLRKALAMFLAASSYWIDLGLATPSLPDALDLPADCADLEPAYLELACALWGRSSSEAPAGAPEPDPDPAPSVAASVDKREQRATMSAHNTEGAHAQHHRHRRRCYPPRLRSPASSRGRAASARGARDRPLRARAPGPRVDHPRPPRRQERRVLLAHGRLPRRRCAGLNGPATEPTDGPTPSASARDEGVGGTAP